MELLDLPLELLSEVCSASSDFGSLVALGQSCRAFRGLLSRPMAWRSVRSVRVHSETALPQLRLLSRCPNLRRLAFTRHADDDLRMESHVCQPADDADGPAQWLLREMDRALAASRPANITHLSLCEEWFAAEKAPYVILRFTHSLTHLHVSGCRVLPPDKVQLNLLWIYSHQCKSLKNLEYGYCRGLSFYNGAQLIHSLTERRGLRELRLRGLQGMDLSHLATALGGLASSQLALVHVDVVMGRHWSGDVVEARQAVDSLHRIYIPVHCPPLIANARRAVQGTAQRAQITIDIAPRMA